MTADDEGPRRGRPRDQGKADAVLDAGWALFLERGVGAVSIEAIAARAGVSKMTVYKHFTDKRTLFEAAVRREMRGIEAAQERGLSEARDAPIEVRLRAFGAGIMSFLASASAVDFYNVLSGELRRHPDLARIFYDAGPRRTIARLAAILAEAGDGLAIDDPEEAAEALFGLWQGATNFRFSPGIDPAAAERALVRRVDRGVALFMRAYGGTRP